MGAPRCIHGGSKVGKRVVLMLGNSYTTSQNLPQLVAQELVCHGAESSQLSRTAAEKNIEVRAITRSGARLKEFFNPQTKSGAALAQLLAEAQAGNIELVAAFLQDMSRGPADTPEAYARACEEACARIRSAAAEPIVYATWAYAASGKTLAKRPYTHEQMYERLQTSFTQAAAHNGCTCANVGAAFEYVWRNPQLDTATADKNALLAAQNPQLVPATSPAVADSKLETPLLTSDGSHPSARGAQLAARVLAHQLYKTLEPRLK